MSNRKKLMRFLRHCQQTRGELMFGTAPQYDAKTGAYHCCHVILMCGTKVLTMPPKAARALAAQMQRQAATPEVAAFAAAKTADPKGALAALADFSRDLVEMAGIAEAYDRARPTLATAAAESTLNPGTRH